MSEHRRDVWTLDAIVKVGDVLLLAEHRIRVDEILEGGARKGSVQLCRITDLGAKINPLTNKPDMGIADLKFGDKC